MREEKYKISVVTPVYNAENTLADTIQSVVNQTIGFEDNIQLILVNDGSPDGSGAICKEYAARYPSNVLYIEKENGGVSSARNMGLEHVEGRYTVFLDSDDTWDESAFSIIYDFFEENEQISLCTCRMRYTGDFKDKTHPLNYKFKKGSRIVNLNDEPNIVCSTIGNNVFRSSAIYKERFNTRLAAGEDASFNYSVLINNPVIGIVADAIFYYKRDFTISSGSSSAPLKKSWYLNVPIDFYLELERKSVEKHGETVNYVQGAILYDLRWRHYNKTMVEDVLSEEEKDEHIRIMHSVLKGIDLKAITKARGLNQYRKLYLANLKYNKEIVREAERRKHVLSYDGRAILNFRDKTMLSVSCFDITNGILHIEGIIRANASKREWHFYILDNDGVRHNPTITRDLYRDIRGYIGEMISEGEKYSADIPISYRTKLRFFLEIDGEVIAMRPHFAKYIGLIDTDKNNYCVQNGYIIKLRKHKLSFYRDRMRTRAMSEFRLSREMFEKKKKGWVKNRFETVRMTALTNNGKIRRKAAFITVRSEDELTENLSMVYEILDAPKAKYSAKTMHKDPSKMAKAAKILYSSKVVVTDDYLALFRNNKKREGQYYVQLWHAAGAFKKFGADIGNMFSGTDAMYHRDYDLVAVSSEHIRDIYANAFQIGRDKVRALGIPRTDLYFDEAYLSGIKETILEKMPELKDKQVIVYAPSFRGGKNRIYMPEIDYGIINKALTDNQIMIICPHPLMGSYEGRWEHDKIKIVQDIPTNELMLLSDLLITDYSSIIFEYSLLNKPMLFFCYDYDEYDRDFYLDYESDLPGEIIRETEELADYLRKGEFTCSSRMTAFKKKYMSACDGNSSYRVAKVIKELLDK